MEGWISLHRRFLDWEWFADEKMVKLFIYLLLKANRKDGNWRGIEIKRGQLITGISNLHKHTNISKQSLRTCLTRLKKTGEINIKSTNKYSIITVCEYDSYQDNKQSTNNQGNKEPTINQQPTNKQPTTNNTSNTDNTLNTDNNKYKKTFLSEINSDDFKELNDEYIKIAQSLQQLFIKNCKDAGIENSTIEKAKGTWIDDVRLMIESDKRTVDQFRKIFKFLSSSDFWKSNILSTSKLRKQFERLLIQSNYVKGKSSRDTTKELLNEMESIIKQSV